jgi:hypothetical protein
MPHAPVIVADDNPLLDFISIRNLNLNITPYVYLYL